jgi:uncharacterized protein (UPF0335 family)
MDISSKKIAYTGQYSGQKLKRYYLNLSSGFYFAILPPVANHPGRKNMAETGGIAADRLRSLIERIERLEEEKKNIASDVKDIFAEAKSAGFDTKIMKAIIRLRKMEAADRDEQEFLLETYKKALDL